MKKLIVEMSTLQARLALCQEKLSIMPHDLDERFKLQEACKHLQTTIDIITDMQIAAIDDRFRILTPRSDTFHD